jgi:glucokinase
VLDRLEHPTGRDIARAAEAGDQVARTCFAAVGRALGRGLADLVTLVDPGVVVLGGGVVGAAPYFLPSALTAMTASIGVGAGFLCPEVRVSTSGVDAALRGVADLASFEIGRTASAPREEAPV